METQMDFTIFRNLPRPMRNDIIATSNTLMQIAEKRLDDGQGKKEWVKDRLKELIDFSSVPDVIEDGAIDLLIDVMALLMFPDSRRQARRLQPVPDSD